MLQSILKNFILLTMPLIVLSSSTIFSMKRQNPYAHQNMQTPQKSAFHAYDPCIKPDCIQQKNNFVSESFLSETDSETEEEKETDFFSTTLASDYSNNIETLTSASAQLMSMALYNPEIQTFTLQITKSPTKYQKPKKFPCTFDGCTQSCTSKQNLENHKRSHTRERPFKCQICHKSFADKGNLTTHVRRHRGEKSFKCQSCPRSFSASNDRSIHEKTHTGLRFFCPDCNKSYLQQSSLNRHMREKHA